MAAEFEPKYCVRSVRCSAVASASSVLVMRPRTSYVYRVTVPSGLVCVESRPSASQPLTVTWSSGALAGRRSTRCEPTEGVPRALFA